MPAAEVGKFFPKKSFQLTHLVQIVHFLYYPPLNTNVPQLKLHLQVTLTKNEENALANLLASMFSLFFFIFNSH